MALYMILVLVSSLIADRSMAAMTPYLLLFFMSIKWSYGI